MIDPTVPLTTANTTLFTDSGSDFQERFLDDNIEVCPLSINFGQESFKDGVELSSEEFYRRLSTTATMPTTAQPSASEMADRYRAALEQRDYVIGLHLSDRVSGTAEAARSAAKEVGEDRAVVVATDQVACALSLLILRVRARLETGTTLGEIQQLVDHFRSNALTLFTLESLEFLQRGGRIGRAQYMAGSLLKVRPILGIEDGEVNPITKVRGSHKVLPAMRKAIEERTAADRPLRAVIGHAQRPDAVAEVEEMLLEVRPSTTLEYSYELGPTVGTHGGPGTLGLTVVDDPADA